MSGIKKLEAQLQDTTKLYHESDYTPKQVDTLVDDLYAQMDKYREFVKNLVIARSEDFDESSLEQFEKIADTLLDAGYFDR
jgi:hypothetical protein